MTTMSTTVRSWLMSFLGFSIVVLFVASCSSGDPVAPNESAGDTPTTQSTDSDPGSDTESVDAADSQATPTQVPGPTLADEDVANVFDMDAGEQVEDAQGNLVAIYGFVEWPEPFRSLSNDAQTEFPFFGDVQALTDPGTELVALDVGMCAAGIDATGFGTAEFFLHGSLDAVLSTDPVRNRGVLARHPVIDPGFNFPRSAECARGWLPVLSSQDDAPLVARYVLTTRLSGDAEVEQYVYQWDLEPIDELTVSLAEPFQAGQTVTFNEGLLASTEVVVDGWAELIGVPSSIEGTRRVGVSLNYCPASDSIPEFGLGVDGWNLIAAAVDSPLLTAIAATPDQSCVDGWLEFTVPFGAEPTSFFASDGLSATTGYAEWSLVGAALLAPE